MGNRNIQYRSDEIERFYREHRTKWDQFYPSEREVLGRLDIDANTKVLDIGCGCGGLGLALRDHFGVLEYIGVEVNSQAVDTAQQIYPEASFLKADVLTLSPEALGEESIDLVVSLGCIDWNIEFDRMLEKAWSYVRPNGYFLSSFRLVPGPGENDMARSFQYVNFEGKREGEKAPYVVLNARDLFTRLRAFGPGSIKAYGYWGPPSATADTPFDQVCFAVVAMQKRDADAGPEMELDLPEDIMKTLLF